MPHSHHSHSGQFCRHAKQGTTLEDVVRQAIQLGFRTYGLSEHCPRYRVEDLYPEESDLKPDDLRTIFLAFLDEAHRLKRLYTDQIDLLVGLETDYITQLDLDGLERLLEEQGERIEYVVGGMHHVGGVPIDFDRDTWEEAVRQAAERAGVDAVSAVDSRCEKPGNKALSAFLHEYLDAQYTLITRIRPDVLAHLDLCRLYTPAIRLDDTASFPGVWEKVERNVKAVVEYGGMFEASSASLRKGWETGYPGAEVLQLILRLGGKICLSDDSHGPDFVGLNYGRLRGYLVDQGVRDVYFLATPGFKAAGASSNSPQDGAVQQDQPQGPGRRSRLKTRKDDGLWLSDAFWDTCQR